MLFEPTLNATREDARRNGLPRKRAAAPATPLIVAVARGPAVELLRGTGR